MVFFRWIFGLPMAALVTLGLFAMMAGLISMDKGALPEPKEDPDLGILATLDSGPDDPTEHKPTDPLTEQPPETVIPKTLPSKKPGPIIDFPKTEPVKTTPSEKGNMVAPAIQFPPQFPDSCRARAVEGVVLVQFDVTPEGTVTNVQIIESPDRCFNRTVIKAVSKWKYPPAYENGRPVMRYGVVERFNFQLSE